MLEYFKCEFCNHTWLDQKRRPLACPECKMKIIYGKFPVITCKDCGYKWKPKVENPKTCPSCKTANYKEGSEQEVKKEPVICKNCSHTWTPRVRDPKLCPNCRKPPYKEQPDKTSGKEYNHVCTTCGYTWSSNIEFPEYCPNPDKDVKPWTRTGLCRKRNPTKPKWGEMIQCKNCGRSFAPLYGKTPKACRFCNSKKYNEGSKLPFVVGQKVR